MAQSALNSVNQCGQSQMAVKPEHADDHFHGSFSVEEWCRHRKLSRATFYELLQEGKAPRSYRVRNRRYISAEADDAWRQEREADTAA